MKHIFSFLEFEIVINENELRKINSPFGKIEF